jgi:tryptophan halogenase
VAARSDLPSPGGPDSVLASLGYAYHFDASRYAAFLRRLAEANGVVRVEGRIGHVPLDPKPGILLPLNWSTAAASRVSSSSIARAFARSFWARRWCALSRLAHWLPCDRAIAVPAAAGAGRALYPIDGGQCRLALAHPAATPRRQRLCLLQRVS